MWGVYKIWHCQSESNYTMVYKYPKKIIYLLKNISLWKTNQKVQTSLTRENGIANCDINNYWFHFLYCSFRPAMMAYIKRRMTSDCWHIRKYIYTCIWLIEIYVILILFQKWYNNGDNSNVSENLQDSIGIGWS